MSSIIAWAVVDPALEAELRLEGGVCHWVSKVDTKGFELYSDAVFHWFPNRSGGADTLRLQFPGGAISHCMAIEFRMGDEFKNVMQFLIRDGMQNPKFCCDCVELWGRAAR